MDITLSRYSGSTDGGCTVGVSICTDSALMALLIFFAPCLICFLNRLAVSTYSLLAAIPLFQLGDLHLAQRFGGIDSGSQRCPQRSQMQIGDDLIIADLVAKLSAFQFIKFCSIGAACRNFFSGIERGVPSVFKPC